MCTEICVRYSLKRSRSLSLWASCFCGVSFTPSFWVFVPCSITAWCKTLGFLPWGCSSTCNRDGTRNCGNKYDGSLVFCPAEQSCYTFEPYGSSFPLTWNGHMLACRTAGEVQQCHLLHEEEMQRVPRED